jgi:hypothetical protein
VLYGFSVLVLLRADGVEERLVQNGSVCHTLRLPFLICVLKREKPS